MFDCIKLIKVLCVKVRKNYLYADFKISIKLKFYLKTLKELPIKCRIKTKI